MIPDKTPLKNSRITPNPLSIILTRPNILSCINIDRIAPNAIDKSITAGNGCLLTKLCFSLVLCLSLFSCPSLFS